MPATEGSARQAWLRSWMRERGIALWGVADLEGIPTPTDQAGQGYPRAVSWALPVNPGIMAGLGQGPSQAYVLEYNCLNQLLNQQARDLALALRQQGARALALAASERTDFQGIKGAFPHKTAATRAGLGWIGRHCQLITRPHGPWVRLMTVFTDLDLPCARPRQKSLCAKCSRCLEACPAQALKGGDWVPGIPRQELLDAKACDQWKKTHYMHLGQGHVCGICASVCPHGQKALSRGRRD